MRARLGIARELGVPVTARGGGTSQCGQTVNRALVVDCSRHLNALLELDVAGHRCRVEPGLVLDELNRPLKPHGLWFPVAISTASRATLGGYNVDALVAPGDAPPRRARSARRRARRRDDDRARPRHPALPPPGRGLRSRREVQGLAFGRGSTGRPGRVRAGGLQGAVEMCNNNGACRKLAGGVMCPSYRVTREALHVARVLDAALGAARGASLA